MDVEAAYWLVVALAALVPVWALSSYLRSRLGAGDAAWMASARSAAAVREPDDGRPTDPRGRPGHCSSCGAPVDDAMFDHCWRCAGEVSR